MCLLFLLATLGTVLTLISGQYSEHTFLFWSFLIFTAATGTFYSAERQISNTPVERVSSKHLTISIGTAVCGVVAFVLFLWLSITIWL